MSLAYVAGAALLGSTGTTHSAKSLRVLAEKSEAWIEAIAETRDARTSLSKLSEYGCEGSTHLTTARGELEVAVRYEARAPDGYLEVTELPGDSIRSELTGDSATSESSQGTRALDSAQVDRMYAGLHFRYLSLLWLAVNGALSEPTQGGQWAVSLRGADFALAAEKGSSKINRISMEGRSLRGESVPEERIFDDFRSLNGLQIPYRTTIYQNGSIAAITRWDQCWIRPQ